LSPPLPRPLSQNIPREQRILSEECPTRTPVSSVPSAALPTQALPAVSIPDGPTLTELSYRVFAAVGMSASGPTVLPDPERLKPLDT
jgi:hypothetical protein